MGEDGHSSWRGPRRQSMEEPYRMVDLDPHLYGGTSGIAIFFAACERALGGGSYRPLALDTLASVRRKVRGILADPARAERVKFKLGGVFGIGSLLYSLLRVGIFLDEEELIQEAHELSALLTPEKIEGDELLDLVLGSAGALLALLLLDRVSSGPNRNGMTPLELAEACARHLLARRVSYEDRPRSWVTMKGFPPLTGFSHGASGIAYALLRLYERTGEPGLREAANEAFAFERTHFSPEEKNWRDTRSAEPVFLTSWCHGAPGIALGRLRVLGLTDAEVQDEVHLALETTRSCSLTDLDHVCCGNMGRVEVLLAAYQTLGKPELLAEAHEIAHAVLDRATKRGGYGWLPGTAGRLFDPAYFSGAAGVGYTLLRLAGPDQFPCPLLLE